MKALHLILVGVCVVAGGPTVLGQLSVPASKHTAADLSLTLIPEKETYTVNEPLFMRVEFKNLTDRTICFPEPQQAFEDPVVGYVVLHANGPHGIDHDYFIEHFDGIMPNDDKLRAEIEKSWIKLAPNQIYVTKRTRAVVELDAVGEWRLLGGYYSPVAPFNPADSRKKLRALAARVGCTPPDAEAIAAAVANIQVLRTPVDK